MRGAAAFRIRPSRPTPGPAAGAARSSEPVVPGRQHPPAAVAGQLEHLVVIGEQRRAVADADRRDAGARELAVEARLIGGVQRAGRLVEHRVARPREQHPCEGEALLLAGGQHLGPVVLGERAAQPIEDRAKVDAL